jgi:hypothetical protein
LRQFALPLLSIEFQIFLGKVGEDLAGFNGIGRPDKYTIRLPIASGIVKTSAA